MEVLFRKSENGVLMFAVDEPCERGKIVRLVKDGSKFQRKLETEHFVRNFTSRYTEDEEFRLFDKLCSQYPHYDMSLRHKVCWAKRGMKEWS